MPIYSTDLEVLQQKAIDLARTLSNNNYYRVSSAGPSSNNGNWRSNANNRKAAAALNAVSAGNDSDTPQQEAVSGAGAVSNASQIAKDNREIVNAVVAVLEGTGFFNWNRGTHVNRNSNGNSNNTTNQAAGRSNNSSKDKSRKIVCFFCQKPRHTVTGCEEFKKASELFVSKNP